MILCEVDIKFAIDQRCNTRDIYGSIKLKHKKLISAIGKSVNILFLYSTMDTSNTQDYRVSYTHSCKLSVGTLAYS